MVANAYAQNDLPDAGEEQPEAETVVSLEELARDGTNLALQLDPVRLGQIAQWCIEGYTRDKASRADWEDDFDRGMAMLKAKPGEVKTFPYDGCANVLYPLLSMACIQFNARAYPAIVNGPEVAKARVTGDDPNGQKAARAARISEHMSYQLLEEMPEWEGETDTLLLHLPASGMAFRQTQWDKDHERPKSEFISAKRLVTNQNTQDLRTVPLFCKEFERYPYQIKEAQQAGLYREVAISYTGDRDEAQQDMLECHARYDLDEDGYAEPYTVTIHRESQEVLSIVAGFWPKDIKRGEDGKVQSVARRLLIEAYGFIPDPEGGFYCIGFGRLLRTHNEIINTIINQLLDAATLQNAGGGLIGNGVRLSGGKMEVRPGEWRMVNDSGQALKDNFVALPVPQPSAVLFNLLGLMIDSGKEIASIKDVLTGEAPANQPATTTLAMIEQGLQVYTAIYKRIYRSFKGELGIQYDLNGAYLPEQAYYLVLDNPKAIAKSDYSEKDMDVRPVADPNATTSPQKLARAQFLLSTFGQDPLMDPIEIRKRALEAAHIQDTDKLFKQGEDPAQKMAAEQAAGTLVEQKLQNDLLTAQIEKTQAETAKIAGETKAKAVETEPAARELAVHDSIIDHARAAAAGGMGGVAGTPIDQGVLPGAEGLQPEPQAGMAGPDVEAGLGGDPGAAGPEMPGAGG